MKLPQAAHATRLLVDCGVVMAPLFIGTALVEGQRRRDYSARRQPVSALALGDAGWIQRVNFFAAGTLTCLFAAGVRRARVRTVPVVAPWLLGAAGLGLISAGIFATDPVNGYPPGVPDRMEHRTRTGVVHELSAVPVMIGVPVLAVVAGVDAARRSERRWAGYSLATGLVSLVAFIASGAGFGGGEPFARRAGLLQRIGIVTAFGWISYFAVRVRSLRATGPRALASDRTSGRGLPQRGS
jgi:hypothetical protein